jgi:signal transduction histidine kinase
VFLSPIVSARGHPAWRKLHPITPPANAREAFAAGVAGWIGVRTRSERVDANAIGAGAWVLPPLPGSYATLEVSDSGGGMADEVAARTFEPFYTTKFTGRGLGLAAVIGILRSHGGGLRVRSEPGHGSSFKISLPAIQGTAYGTAMPRLARTSR